MVLGGFNSLLTLVSSQKTKEDAQCSNLFFERGGASVRWGSIIDLNLLPIYICWFTLEYQIYISVLCDPIAIHRSVKGLKKYLNNQWTGTTNEEEMIKYSNRKWALNVTQTSRLKKSNLTAKIKKFSHPCHFFNNTNVF